MKRIAILEYTFMFDENSPWRNADQFERDMGLFFANKGINVGPVDVYGDKDKRVLFLEKALPTAPAVGPKAMTFKKEDK